MKGGELVLQFRHLAYGFPGSERNVTKVGEVKTTGKMVVMDCPENRAS